MKTSKRFPGGGSKRWIPGATLCRLEDGAEGSSGEGLGGIVRVDDGEGVVDNAAGSPKRELYRISSSNEEIIHRGGGIIPGIGSGFKWRERYVHAPDAVDLSWYNSGRAPLLVGHDDADYVGKISASRLVNREVVNEVEFAPNARAQEVKADVAAGFRQSSSQGVIPLRVKLVEENAEEGDLWDITKWKPVELSLVPVPANMTVGVINNDGGDSVPPVEIEEGGETPMPKTAEELAAEAREAAERANAANPAGDGTGRTGNSGNGAGSSSSRSTVEVQGKRKAVAEIYKLAHRKHVPDDIVDGWIDRGLTPAECALEILNREGDASGANGGGERQPDRENVVELSRKEQKTYSYRKAILMQLPKSQGGIEMEGLEYEVHKTIVDKHSGPCRGIMVPVRLGDESHPIAERYRQDERVRARYAMDTLTAGAGQETIFDQAGEMIDLLRNKARLAQMGAQIYTGLTGGAIGFPVLLQGLAAEWLPEGATSNRSDLVWGLKTLRPRRLSGRAAFTRELLTQSAFSIEKRIRSEIATAHVLAYDRAGLHGTGAGATPVGIYHADGVQIEDFSDTVPTYAKLVEMGGKVADANADEGALGYMTTPLMAAKLKTVLEFPDAPGGSPIWTGNFRDGSIAGFRAAATKQVSRYLIDSEEDVDTGVEHGIIFGDFSQVYLATFAAMELIVDIYSLKNEGMIEVASWQTADCLIAHPEAFCKAHAARRS